MPLRPQEVDERAHKCSRCRYSSDTKNDLLNHIAREHRKGKKCPHCDYASNHPQTLRNHVQTVHDKVLCCSSAVNVLIFTSIEL